MVPGHAPREPDGLGAEGVELPAGTYDRVTLDYPVTPRARAGWGQPPNPYLYAVLDGGRGRYRVVLEAVLGYRDQLLAIPRDEPSSPAEPAWVNGWLPALDGAAIYTFLADRDPELYLEVGSGWSTKFARRAVDDHGLRTRIVSIDPHPRAEIDAICDEVVRQPLEDCDLAVFDRAGPGDVVFVDNSHRCFMNSDATVVLLEVLPRLRPGVLLGIHDIHLPDDYPPDWADRFYSEQYVLGAFLLGGGAGTETELPAWFVSTDAELAAVLDSLFDHPLLAGIERHGGAFWLRITGLPA
ncbi:MAG: class I SAM-dependent methyltransferase [Acidimicrobiales bacterium]|nr:class I SAM-dependent methyltransferase [Acidimicrobiales bacterium]